MPISENFEIKTGFDLIREMLKANCMGEAGRWLAAEMHFSSNAEMIEHQLAITDEFRTMLLTVFGYPASEYFNLENELNYIGTEGTFLTAETLISLKVSYQAYLDAVGFIDDLFPAQFPKLKAHVEGVITKHAIITEIDRIVDHSGVVRDNASPELLNIRKEMSRLTTAIDRRIAEALLKAKQQKIVPTEAEIAIRDGRAVIPVASALKRKLAGVIIDESSSGQTSYIEPVEVFEIRNQIRELEISEKREIIRILVEFANFLRPFAPLIKGSLDFLAGLDFLRAKALLAIETNSLKPTLFARPGFTWLQARHPLLMLSLRKQKREVVPSDISLSDQNRILIVSGPNAGGKSVCLKTVGLLQYMLQCGLLIPVLDTSEAGIFKSLFIDIGDQQSIENDLSTYSSHLINIKKLLLTADRDTLFLIDEFGAGTEPQSGGAIAEAVLETLNQKKAYGVVTTHYANLKLLAANHEGFVNGAMLYDSKHLKPLFVLRTGRPGSSFAFEIAANIEFPVSVLENAATKVGREKLDFDKQMQDLESERLELSQKEKQLQKADEALSELISRYSSLKSELDIKKKDIIEKAQAEAKNIIADSNRIIEKTIREIRESQANSLKVKLLRTDIKEFSETIDSKPVNHQQEQASLEKNSPDPEGGIPNAGDLVKLTGQTETGILMSISGQEATVAFDQMTVKIPLSKLVKAAPAKQMQKKINRGFGYQNMVNDMNARMANFKLSIDIRGKKADEVETLIQRYIDEAIMLHVKDISILHGKGNGVLRSVIRQYLQTVTEIKHFGDAPVELGGAGITQVTFK